MENKVAENIHNAVESQISGNHGLLPEPRTQVESEHADDMEKGKSSVVGEDESSFESPGATKHESESPQTVVAEVVDPKAGKIPQKNKRVGHFVCPIAGCGRVYKRKGDLKVHMVKKHKESETSKYYDIMKPRSSAEGKTYICPYQGCGDTHGYLRMRGLRRHLTLKHGGRLPRDLVQTEENAYLFRTSFARRSQSSEPSEEESESEVSPNGSLRRESEAIEDVIEQELDTGNADSEVGEGRDQHHTDVRTSKRIRKPKVRDSPEHPHKKRKYTRRNFASEEGEPMTLKIPSTLIDDLRDEPLQEATEAIASLAHVAVPAAQPMPFPMQMPMQMPFLPQQSLYQGFPPGSSFPYPSPNPQMYSPTTPMMLPPMTQLGLGSFPVQPQLRQNDVFSPPIFFPSQQLTPLSPSLKSLQSQLPKLILPSMLPPLPATATPEVRKDLPPLQFSSQLSTPSNIVLTESFLPPAPLTSYLYHDGPFKFKSPLDSEEPPKVKAEED